MRGDHHNDENLAFERLVRPHFDRLYRLAWRLAGRKAEAEDLFQELLIKAYGKLDELVKIDEPASWLSRVMYNLFVLKKGRCRETGLRDFRGLKIRCWIGKDGRRFAHSTRPCPSSATNTALLCFCTTRKAINWKKYTKLWAFRLGP
jgi:hypothetical protein